MVGRSLALLLALAAWEVGGQVYRMEDVTVPAPFSLSMHYLFYVYSPKDAPMSTGGAQASVEFRQIAAEWKVGNGQPPRDYDSLQVSMLPMDKFWDLVDRQRFCSTTEDVAAKMATKPFQLVLTKPISNFEAEGVRIHQIPLGSQPTTVSFPIKESGRYILTVSNCGNYSKATFTGSVAVRNAHGYLPAYEVNVMRMAGWSALVHLGIFVIWLSASLRHLKNLFYIQKGICIVSLLCVLEAFVLWLDHQDWNTTGNRRDPLFFASILLYTLKYVLSWRLILLASLGAGVVFEDMDTKTALLFFCASTLFLLQSSTWKMFMAYRFSHALDPTFLLLLTFPGILIYTGMFAWTFLLLSKMVTRLQEQKRDDLSGLFLKVRVVLIVGFLLSTLNAILQIFDIAKNVLAWHNAWLSVDGAPQWSFSVIVVAMMFVWWPSEDSWKYGYQVQTNADEDEEEAEAVSTRVAVAEEVEPRPKKANDVVPEAIGVAREEREGEDGEDLL